MADIMMCEPFELYNLLNQCSRVSRLAEINYLCLTDARETQDYRTSHIITAKNVKMDSESTFLLPVAVEVDSMQHVVVYDSNTSCLQEKGRAVECAQALAEVSLCPVHIVRGGFQRFSALYPFLRTEKIIYTITELENLKMYPVEIMAGLLYMGNKKQGLDSSILKDLKINAIISITQSDALESRPTKENQTVLNIPVADSVASDLYSSFEIICTLIDSHINMGSRVLIVSRQGRSRCSAVTIAFLMHHLKYTLKTTKHRTLPPAVTQNLLLLPLPLTALLLALLLALPLPLLLHEGEHPTTTKHRTLPPAVTQNLLLLPLPLTALLLALLLALPLPLLLHEGEHPTEAWTYTLKCKPDMRPNTGFLQQLSDWELNTMGTKVTDISEPHF